MEQNTDPFNLQFNAGGNINYPVTRRGLQFSQPVRTTSVDYSFGTGATGPGLRMPGQASNASQFQFGNNDNNQFDWNTNTVGLGFQGLNSLAGLYTGLQQLKLAKDQFDFTKQYATTNLNNQTRAYNTQLEDKLRTEQQANQSGQATFDEKLARQRATV